MGLKRRNVGLSKREVEELRTRLENWHAQLRAAAGQITKEGRDITDDSPLDVADRAINASAKEFLFRQAHERHRLLQAVDTALERMREGTFGECAACGASISSKRLEAVPWTQYCVACQEKLERGELPEEEASAVVPSFERNQRMEKYELRTGSSEETRHVT
ncbi:MAG: TraR/DksA family transcriptional regulator [Terriglobales bacterium]